MKFTVINIYHHFNQFLTCIRMSCFSKFLLYLSSLRNILNSPDDFTKIFIELNRMFFYFHSTYVNKFYVCCRELYHLKFSMLYDCACSLSDGDFKKYACFRNTLGHKVVKMYYSLMIQTSLILV